MITVDRTEPAADESVWGRDGDRKLSPPDLSQVRGYTHEDVGYNQVGRQSPSQQSQGYDGIVGQFLGLGVCGAFAVFGLLNGVFIIPSVMLLVVVYGAFQMVADLMATSKGDVTCIEGDIWTKLVSDSEGPDTYFVHIGDKKLSITADAYDALKPGGPYRIYYVKGRAVGGQVLSGWRAAPPEPKKRSWWQMTIEL